MITADAYKHQLAQALPKGLTADRMVRVVLTAMNRNPKLLECTKESMWQSVLDCAALGLFPDALGRAYLVPYGSACQLIIGYKGLVDLAYRSERVVSIQVVIVREGDKFIREPLALPPIKHEIRETENDAFRRMTHVYSVVYLKDCTVPSVDVMSKREVDDIRARSKSGKSGPWVTDYEEMAKKTVFRRHAKMLPMSAELAQAIDTDADQIDMTVPAPANRFAAEGKTVDTTAEHVPDATPAITEVDVIALAKTKDDADVDRVLETYGVHTIKGCQATTLAAIHGEMVKCKAKT
jgi:recombination protein RecT